MAACTARDKHGTPETWLPSITARCTGLIAAKAMRGISVMVLSNEVGVQIKKHVPKFLEGLETEKLERELREAKAEVQLLQMRYDTLESKAKAQRDIQKSQFDQLDEYNRRIRDLRRALQDAQADKEDAERKA